MTEPTLCPRHPHRQTTGGARLCATCIQTAGANLRYIATHWHHLHQLHTSTSANNGTHSPRLDPPAPCRVDVLDTQRDLAAILHAWTRLIVEDRELSTSPTSPPAQAMWIATVHLEWLTATDFADEAADEFRDMRWTLATVIGDTRHGQRVNCPLDECGTPIRINITDPDEHVQCRGCGATWTAAMLLLHAVTGEAEAWVDAEAITAVTGISRPTLDRWARGGHIRRRHGLYVLGEVIAYRDTQRSA